MHASSAAGGIIVEELSKSDAFKAGAEIRTITNASEERFVVTVPFERLDIRIKEDLIDEISKFIGTDEVSATTDYANAVTGQVYTMSHYANTLRNSLIERGYSEIMTSSFASEGDISILHSVDSNKNKLRNNLQHGLGQALVKGLYYAPFLGLETIRVFEIGTVFFESREEIRLCIGIASKNKKIKKNLVAVVNEAFDAIQQMIGENVITEILHTYDEAAGTCIYEYVLVEHTQNASHLHNHVQLQREEKTIQYKTLSQYPFITRDIAVFVPEAESVEDLEEILNHRAGDLCVKLYQFDKYQKEGESSISYGYRLVFQSCELTLTDVEVEAIMSEIYMALQNKNWQIR